LPPSPSAVHFLDEEIAANEEGIDDDTNAAANDADDADNADADDYATDDIAAAAADATMLPKVKPPPTKPTKKDAAAAAVKPPPHAAAAAAAATSFSVDANDTLTDSYYVVGAYDYADAVFRVNGTMQMGEYQVRVAEDGLSVSFVCAISSRSFDKKILRKIMGGEYHESSSHVVAWDDTGDASEECAPREWSLLGRATGGAAKVEVHGHSHPCRQARLPDGVQGERQTGLVARAVQLYRACHGEEGGGADTGGAGSGN
jgi:hypothetical protein